MLVKMILQKIIFLSMKDFDALVEKKLFFDQLVKSKQEGFEKFVKISRNDDYTTGNLLDHFYYQKYYKLIDTDLSRQTYTTIPQQINFTEILESDHRAKKSLITKKTILSFSLDSLNITE